MNLSVNKLGDVVVCLVICFLVTCDLSAQDDKVLSPAPESSIVLSVIGDSFRTESRPYRFGTSVDNDAVRPFAFSQDGNLFLYAFKDTAFVVDARRGNHVWTSFKLDSWKGSENKEHNNVRVVSFGDQGLRAIFGLWSHSLVEAKFAEIDGNKVLFKAEASVDLIGKQVSTNWIGRGVDDKPTFGDDQGPYLQLDDYRSKSHEMQKFIPPADLGYRRHRFMGSQHVSMSHDKKLAAFVADRKAVVDGEDTKRKQDLWVLQLETWTEARALRPTTVKHRSADPIALSPTYESVAFSPNENRLAVAYTGWEERESAPFGGGPEDEKANQSERSRILLFNLDQKVIEAENKDLFAAASTIVKKPIRFLGWASSGKHLVSVSMPEHKNNDPNREAITSMHIYAVMHNRIGMGFPNPDLLQWSELGVLDVAVSPTQNHLAIANANNTVRIYSFDNLGKKLEREFSQKDAASLMFSPDGSQLVCHSTSGRIKVYRMKDLLQPAIEYSSGR